MFCSASAIVTTEINITCNSPSIIIQIVRYNNHGFKIRHNWQSWYGVSAFGRSQQTD